MKKGLYLFALMAVVSLGFMSCGDKGGDDG